MKKKRMISVVLLLSMVLSLLFPAMVQATETESVEETYMETETEALEAQMDETDVYETTETAEPSDAEIVDETAELMEAAEAVPENVIVDDPEAYLHESDLIKQESPLDLFGNASMANKKVKAYGVDVSQWQGAIDWNKVKSAGVDFAMVRVGYRGYAKGTLVTDNYAEANLAGAQSVGIKIGAYFFSTAITEAEAVEEAKYMINIVKKYHITYPLCYDNEGMYLIDEDGDGTPETKQRDYDLTAAQRTKIGTAFLDYCKSQGYDVLMYGNTSCFNGDKEFIISELEKKYDIWIAAYPWKANAEVGYASLTELLNEKKVLSYQRPYRIWQFSSEGKVNGISGNADINVEYYSDFETATGTLDAVSVEGYLNVMVSDVKAPYTVKAVQISVWSDKNGMDDMHTYNLTLNQAGYYLASIRLADYHKDLGSYTVLLSYVDGSGQKYEVTSRSVKVRLERKPTAAVTGLKAVSAGKQRVTLTWDEHPEAEGYLIYGIRGDGKYGYIGMTTKGTTFTDTKALGGDYNFYWVFPYGTDADDRMLVGPACKYVFAKGLCAPVQNLKAASRTGGVQLSWTASKDAEGYLIYGIRGNDKYGYAGMTKSTAFLDKKASGTSWNFYWVYPYHMEDGRMITNTQCKYTYGKAL